MNRNLENHLTSALDQALEARAKFVPACAPKTYTTNVYPRELVKDCDAITPAEENALSPITFLPRPSRARLHQPVTSPLFFAGWKGFPVLDHFGVIYISRVVFRTTRRKNLAAALKRLTQRRGKMFLKVSVQDKTSRIEPDRLNVY